MAAKRPLGDGPALLRTMAAAVSVAGTPEEKRRTRSMLAIGVFLTVVLTAIGYSLYARAQESGWAAAIQRVQFCAGNPDAGSCPAVLRTIHFEQGEKNQCKH